jgi:PAS domain S-box-containing protein
MPHRFSIRVRLVGLVLGVALPLVALEAWNLYSDAEEDSRAARLQVLHLAEITAAETARFLGQAHGIVRGLAARPAIRALDPARCDPILGDVLALAPRFANVATMTLDGTVVCSGVPVRRPARMDPEKFLGRLRGPDELTVGQITPGTITGRWAVPVGLPLLDAQGRVAGAVGLAIDLVNFPVLPSIAELPAKAVIGIVGADGVVLVHSGDPGRFVGTNQGGLEIVRLILREKRGAAEETGIDGVARIQGFAPVAGTDWIAVASVPAGDVYAGVWARSALIAAAVLAAVSLIAWVVGRGIERPISAFARAVGRVAAGDAAARAPAMGPPELADVAGELNRMLDARGEAERQLRASEERFHKLFAHASLPMSVSVEDTGELLDANDAFCALFGYSRAQIVGRTSVELGLWADPQERAEITARLRAGGSVRGFETRRRLRSGEEREVLVNVDLIELGGRACAFAILADITGYKRAERERAAAYERFEKIFHAAPVAMAITTLEAGRILEVNPAYCAFIGRARDELVGRSVLELRLWADAGDRARLAERLRAERRVQSFEARVRTLGGELRDVLSSAERIEFFGEPCMLVISEDITARKDAERAQRQANEQLRQLIDNLFSFVGVLSPEGVLLEANQTALRAAGVRSEEVLGRPVEDTYWIAHSEASRARMRAAVARAAGGEPVRYDTEVRVAGGQLVTIDFALMPVRGADGGVVRLVASGVDVTERKRAQEGLRAANERLHALSRRLFEVQEQERAAIARELHDEFGQALTALKLGASALGRRLKGAPAEKAAQLREIADTALTQTRNLALNLRPPQLDQLGLVATLRDYLERLAAGAGFEARLVADELSREPQRDLATTVFRVAQEALTNAARHANASNVVVELHARGSELLLAVSDDGRGFDHSAARAQAIQGKSMGLLGMEERVALAGGRMTVVTRSGQGTRVQAVFPLERGAREAAA